MDIHALITFSYRTSPGDEADAKLLLSRQGGPIVRMLPGSYALSTTSRHGSAVTLSWARRNVPARGRAYTVGLEVLPRAGRASGAPGSSVSGGKVTALVELS